MENVLNRFQVVHLLIGTVSDCAMSSGVAVADECKAIFEEIKKSKRYRYCIFHIKDERVISVEDKGDRDASYGGLQLVMLALLRVLCSFVLSTHCFVPFS